jgi:putative two-component system response regulator
VIILTASCDQQTKNQALSLGATDFLAKPVMPEDLIPRVRNTLTVKAHQDHLLNQAAELERLVIERTSDLISAQRELIHCLARAADYRDNETGKHVMRVGLYAGIIARELDLGERLIELISQAAPLHDLGKIGIPDSILLKPGKLYSDEIAHMQRHCGYGKKIVGPQEEEEARLREHTDIGARIMGYSGSPVLKIAARIALTHHERWDGSGYPLGLAGEDIPIEGRITAVADVFDALSSKRVYKPAFPLEKCFRIMQDARGSQFDPTVLDAFFRRKSDIVDVQIQYADTD